VTVTVVETAELTKVYGETIAVDKLNLKIGEGEVFGFLGPNGAGKTTTILMLLGLTEPTYGEARISGYNTTFEPLNVKRITGYLPENVGFYNDLTARENLRYITRLNSMRRQEATGKIDEALKSVGLMEVADKEVGKFSKGMKQRLGIADVLVKDPKLVILDEPTTGIDPAGVSHVLDVIIGMARNHGITVLLSSHLLNQVQKICDRVGIIAKGKLVAEGSIEKLNTELFTKGQNAVEVQVTELTDGLMNLLRSIVGVTGIDVTGNSLSIFSDRDVKKEVSKAIVESGSLPIQIKTRDYALEEIYMKYFSED